MIQKHARGIYHFFQRASNVRPIIWIASYVALVPVFALIYWWLPDGQFRIPDNAGTDFGSWLYYSIVTITTLGFGDYTPAHGWAQAVTAIEVMCGLILLGFFLNAVGSLKSEIDVESEVEKQKRAHFQLEKEKLSKSLPMLLQNLQRFLSFCYAVTTPASERKGKNNGDGYNSDFEMADMADMLKPSQLAFDHTNISAVNRLMKSASSTSLCLDSLEQRIDLTLWPDVLEQCFSFVANWQMFSSSDILAEHPEALLEESERKQDGATEQKVNKALTSLKGKTDVPADSSLKPVGELLYFIKENAKLARDLEKSLAVAAASSYPE